MLNHFLLNPIFQKIGTKENVNICFKLTLLIKFVHFFKHYFLDLCWIPIGFELVSMTWLYVTNLSPIDFSICYFQNSINFIKCMTKILVTLKVGGEWIHVFFIQRTPDLIIPSVSKSIFQSHLNYCINAKSWQPKWWNALRLCLPRGIRERDHLHPFWFPDHPKRPFLVI